jgi:hypothetical protein
MKDACSAAAVSALAKGAAVMIAFSAGVPVDSAAGHTDMTRGFDRRWYVTKN